MPVPALRGALLCALAIPLAGCIATANERIASVTASDRFAQICANEPVAHSVFVLLAPQAGVSYRLIAAEQAAHAVVRSVCANPPADVASALAAVSEAYAVVLQAQAAVEG